MLRPHPAGSVLDVVLRYIFLTKERNSCVGIYRLPLAATVFRVPVRFTFTS